MYWLRFSKLYKYMIYLYFTYYISLIAHKIKLFYSSFKTSKSGYEVYKKGISQSIFSNSPLSGKAKINLSALGSE